MKNHQSKTILVTGGAGFIGSEFVRQCVHARRQVIVVDKLTYAGDLQRLTGLKNRILFHKADICHRSRLQKIFRTHNPDMVIHFAAETHVDRSLVRAEPFWETNVHGTLNLIDAARQTDVKKFIHISTDEVYGEILTGKAAEDQALQPTNPYAVTKTVSEQLVSAAIKTGKLPALIVRPCNNYGPWQFPEKLVPVIISKAMASQPIPIYGQGGNIREWMHVSDCARAVRHLMIRGRVGEAYNVSPSQAMKNIDIARLIVNMMGRPLNLIHFIADRPGHDFRYALDWKKIKKTGWKPKIPLKNGLRSTIEWYLNHSVWLKRKIRSIEKR